MKIIRKYCCCFILWMEVLEIFSTGILEMPVKSSYFNGLVNYLKDESKLYEVVFILDDYQFDNTDPMMNSLMKSVNAHFPSLSLNYNQIPSWFKRITLKQRRHLRKTTLFIFQAENENNIKVVYKNLNVINSKTELSLTKCLIMTSFNSTHEYLNSTLHFFWRKSYLDITIMTYDQNHQVAPFLNQINPFTNNYTTVEISSTTQWFPNKLRNLNGHKMTFQLISNYGYEKAKYHMRTKITNIFEKAMNFQDISKTPDTCKEHMLFISMQDYTKDNVDFHIGAKSLRVLKIDSVKVIIPRKEKFTMVLFFSPELLQMLIATISTIVIIQFFALLMKFKSATWQTWNISQIIIGMPSNQEPNSWLERIVFGSLLIACIVYTGYFYSVILDISLMPEAEISTLEELANSSLTPLVSPKVCGRLNRSSIPYIKKLGSRSQCMPLIDMIDYNYCLKYLIKHGNVSCIYADAENRVNIYSALVKRQLDVKILSEAVDYSTFHWTVKGNSPYTDRYNKIILRASEFGLLKEYYSSVVLPQKISPPEEIKKAKLFFIASYVLGIGYSLSIIVFLLEILTKLFNDKMNSFYTSFRLA